MQVKYISKTKEVEITPDISTPSSIKMNEKAYIKQLLDNKELMQKNLDNINALLAQLETEGLDIAKITSEISVEAIEVKPK